MRLLRGIWVLTKKLCNQYVIPPLLILLLFTGTISIGTAFLMFFAAVAIDVFFNRNKSDISLYSEDFHKEPQKNSGISLTKILCALFLFDTFFNNHDS